MTIADEKKKMRAVMQKRRDALLPEQRQAWSAMLCQRVTSLPEFQRAHCIHVFCSFGSEPDTAAIIQAAFASGKRVVVPVTPPATAVGLQHVEIAPEQQYTTGVFGIPVPHFPDAELYPFCAPQEFFSAEDCILVPLLAFDSGNHRLGYGKGFYDRFLAQTSGTTIGVAFALQCVEYLPVEPHDRALDMVVTEKLP